MPLYVYTDPTGRRMTLGHEDVIHVRMLSLDGVTGRSPIAACRDSLGLNAALATHARATFENRALPSGLDRAGRADRSDTMDRLSTGWSARHQGPANRGQV